MSNNKSPGSDGFQTEFYKFFWQRLKHFFICMFNECKIKGVLPLTLREGLICLVPKKERPRDEIKGYRPITLLNVAYKIVAGALANRIKEVLVDIIEPEQTAFLRGRFIGDNTRLIYDMIQHLKTIGKKGMILAIDLESAFDSMNWSFVEASLDARGFPFEMIQWFKLLHERAFARISYNGHLSKEIFLERSCRQGDPVSCYFFILALDHLLSKIKSDNDIKGVFVNGTEYKISSYADDTVCILEGDVNSIRKLFHDLGTFAKFSGLYPNIGKCKAMWVGKLAPNTRENNMEYLNLPFESVSYLKILGVVFENDLSKIQITNYTHLISNAKRIMSLWKGRNLTLIGKITIIKSLILSQFTHLFTALPKPFDNVLKQFNKQLYEFLWGSKRERIKRRIITESYENGGLRMVDLGTYISALKATWVKRQLISSHPWVNCSRARSVMIAVYGSVIAYRAACIF